MNVLFLPKYGPKAASTRHRYLQYFPHLESEGISCHASPLLDDAYLAKKFETGRTPPVDALRGYTHRLLALTGARRFDLAMVHCELFPYLPSWGEAILPRLGVPYVYDFDDAIFHNYDQSRLSVVRALFSGKLARVARGAALVTAGNEYLAAWSRRFQRRVEVLPTVVDLARFPRVSPARAPGPFVIGWIGSPSTAPYVSLVAEALAQVSRGDSARVVLVGSGPVDLPGVPVEVRPWSEATEAADIGRFDVGVMPLPDTPWARGKSGFKLIQYMAGGLPVVASPVGANRDIVEHGVNGFLAGTAEEWVSALETLRADPGLRDRMGRAGRERVRQRYSLAVTAPRLAGWLREAAGRVRIPGAARSETR